MAKVKAKARARKTATNARHKRKKSAKVTCAACKKTCATRYQEHQKKTSASKQKLTKAQQDSVDKFKQHWAAHHAEYEAVADQTGTPAPLIAAIKWREKEGDDMNVYLQNGQTLGKATTIEPKNVRFPTGHFQEAAVAGLNQKDKKACRDQLGMDKNTTDRGKLATFAEKWNGTGYPGGASPYVYAGTDQYTSGFYPRDHFFDPNQVDKRVGVMPLIDAISPSSPSDGVVDDYYPPSDTPLYVPVNVA